MVRPAARPLRLQLDVQPGSSAPVPSPDWEPKLIATPLRT